MESTTGGVTVSVVEPVSVSNVAPIEDVPTASALATPADVMDATAGVADAQITTLVMS
jgi:hypothetical protein